MKQILNEALAMPASDRSVYLDGVIGAKSELRKEVDGMLAEYESGFLENTAISVAASALAESGLTTGQIVGRYKIGELIGTGGMGEVFRAADTELDRSVAFKVLHSDVAEDEERVRRFIQEARAASALNHPNILTIHEIGTFEGSRFIVSEYVDGATLRERMSQGLTTSESIDITCQIAAALQAAHAAGIVHRDIKPENVMIRKDGLVKVLDFGLAKLTEADDRPIDASAPLSHINTSPGLVMGTVAYMSPEQARGQSVDARTDLWSLGVVLHEMLTGRSPFEGESVTELISSIIAKETAPADLDSLPPDLRPICKKALAKDKDSRYRSAHDLLFDLEGEKKRMEYAIDSKKYVTVSTADERKTQVIGPRRTLSAEYIVYQVSRHKYLTFSVILTVMFIALGLAAYRYNAATQSGASGGVLPAITAGTTDTDLKMLRIPTSGAISAIAVSPDGKYVAYVPGDKNPIRLRELQSGKETELVSAQVGVDLYGLNFSPDGKFLDYAYDQTHVSIYRVATSGGTAPTKIIEKSDGGGSVSPDGKYLFFERDNDVSDDFFVANVDGANERIVLQTPYKDKMSWVECDGVPGGLPTTRK